MPTSNIKHPSGSPKNSDVLAGKTLMETLCTSCVGVKGDKMSVYTVQVVTGIYQFLIAGIDICFWGVAHLPGCFCNGNLR